MKDSVLSVRFGGDEFGSSEAAQLAALLKKQQPQDCIVNLMKPEVIEAPEDLEAVQDQWFEDGYAMVFILRPAHYFLFSENCVMVESHQEAIDWLEENQE